MAGKVAGLALCVALQLAASSTPARAQQAAAEVQQISLNANNLDIRQFFQLLHQRFAVNIVVAPDVNGRVTAFLTDVSWRRALDDVLKANNLVSEQDGDVLRIMTAEGAQRDAEVRKSLAEAAEAAVPLETCTYIPRDRVAGEIAQVLQPLLSAQGRISVDVPMNTIIVRDRHTVLKELGLSPASPPKGSCSTAVGPRTAP